MQAILPSRSIAVLMAIGFLDLVMTAWLHQRGLIVEMNPLMRPLIERSEWLFSLVKASTLVACWIAMARYTKVNRQFVRQASLIGSAVYLTVWVSWFLGSL